MLFSSANGGLSPNFPLEYTKIRIAVRYNRALPSVRLHAICLWYIRMPAGDGSACCGDFPRNRQVFTGAGLHQDGQVEWKRIVTGVAPGLQNQ